MSLLPFVRSSLARFAFVAIATAGLLATTADARPGRGSSVGSRGANTYKAPAPTNTAPSAAPIQKSMTNPGVAAQAATTGATAAAAQAAKPSMMRNLLLGGLIGAGLASILGTGAMASVLGFLLQGLLIAGIVVLAVMLFRRFFAKPAVATANAAPSPTANPAQANLRQAASVSGGALPALQLADADFGAFDRLLGEIQTSYSRGDLKALGDRMTPEMLSYFAGELDDCKRRGVHNELGQPKLLQGDLSECWRETGSEFATVAMRYSMTDAVINLASGEVVAGSRTKPDEVTEIWTFRRDPNTGPNAWELSAIQQTA